MAGSCPARTYRCSACGRTSKHFFFFWFLIEHTYKLINYFLLLIVYYPPFFLLVESSSNDGAYFVGDEENAHPIFIWYAEGEYFGKEWAYFPRRKIYHSQDLLVLQLLFRVVRNKLGARNFYADFGAEVDG